LNTYNTHPHNNSAPGDDSAPGDADLKFSKLFGISGVVFGWNGVSYKYGGPEY